MQQHPGLAGDLADLSYRLDGADLVVGVHHRYQDGVRADGLADALRVDQPAAVHRDSRDLVAELLQVFHGLEDGVMLDGRSHQVTALLMVSTGRSQDGPVIGLSAATGEVDLFRTRAEMSGEGLAGVLHRLGRRQTETVDR